MAAILGGIGSAIGITAAAQTVTGILSEDDTKFGQLLPIAAMPGTQGIYGFIAAVLVLVFFNILGGSTDLPRGPASRSSLHVFPPASWSVHRDLPGSDGRRAAGIVAAGKRAPALVFPALVETYAIFALIVTILMLLGLQAAYAGRVSVALADIITRIEATPAPRRTRSSPSARAGRRLLAQLAPRSERTRHAPIASTRAPWRSERLRPSW